MPTAQQPRGATAGAEANPSPWAGPEGTWLGLCLSPGLDIKQGPAGGEEADLGTMETQRNSPSLRRWSLLLLLLGLAMPPATAQALSYREAVLRAVDGYNQRSSEANLYRLLELDQEPQGVSWGRGCGGTLLPPGSVALPPPLLMLDLLSGRPFSLLVGSYLSQEIFPKQCPLSARDCPTLESPLRRQGAPTASFWLQGLLGVPRTGMGPLALGCDFPALSVFCTPLSPQRTGFC